MFEREATERVLREAALTPLSDALWAVLRCPEDRGELRREGEAVVCGRCGRRYPVVAGVPLLVVEAAS